MGAEFLLDVHTHTLASGHAYGTIREMAQAAQGKGLALLGISEHAPGIPGTADPIYYYNLNTMLIAIATRDAGGIQKISYHV